MTDLLTENARLRAALEAAKRDTALALAQVDRLLTLTTTLATERDDSREYAVALEAELKARAALATPAHDAVQEAARVPEIAALIKAAGALGVRDMVAGWNGEGREHRYTPHPARLRAKINTTCGAVYALDAAIRAIAGDRT